MEKQSALACSVDIIYMGACGEWMGVDVDIGGDRKQGTAEMMRGEHVSAPKGRG